ncbi:MAG: HAD family hydrolase [Oscillospiraceae bacterium]|nr:HAD family hydrolase [Oscillospiraceae bacterium]
MPSTHRPIVFFDWDGTIADSMPLCFAEVRAAIRKMGLPMPSDELIAACNGPTQEESVDVLHIPHERAAEYLQARQEAEMALIPSIIKLYPGIREVLDRLREAADLMIVSNGYQGYVEASALHTGLGGYFARIEAAKHGRTKAEAIAELIREYEPRKAAMAGDRLGDIQSGMANGLPTVAACFGYGFPEEWAEATAQAHSVEEMGEILLGWIG